MPSSTRREEIDVGIGDVDDSVRRMFPFELRNFKSSAGVKEGPRPEGALVAATCHLLPAAQICAYL